ncbi:hypothetical protein GIB67_004283 [Kingdonia uniflora]|uniref:Uncharacterized protein n=1 Tax=Kingdonia uniflora TaxID=39325 RepID=A0A7J7MR07_9MAGN|nr:hypothetical protein GIB67_004283 [Kingdonia uniflora]
MSRVYVGNLDPRVTERELEDEFRVFGVLRNVWVARKPPGYAFVEFDDRRDALDAIRALDGKSGWRVELSHNSKGGGGGRGGGSSFGGGGRGRGGGGGDDLKCYECGEPGHFARECRLRVGSRGMGSGRRRSPSPRRRRSPSYGRRSYSPVPAKRSPRRRSITPRRGRSFSRSPPPYRAARRDSPPYANGWFVLEVSEKTYIDRLIKLGPRANQRPPPTHIVFPSPSTYPNNNYPLSPLTDHNLSKELESEHHESEHYESEQSESGSWFTPSRNDLFLASTVKLSACGSLVSPIFHPDMEVEPLVQFTLTYLAPTYVTLEKFFRASPDGEPSISCRGMPLKKRRFVEIEQSAKASEPPNDVMGNWDVENPAKLDPHLREALWSLFSLFSKSVSLPWLVIGDLNCIISKEEKFGKILFDCTAVNSLEDFVFEASLVDLGYSGPHFTWSNKRKGLELVKKRLDRINENISTFRKGGLPYEDLLEAIFANRVATGQYTTGPAGDDFIDTATSDVSPDFNIEDENDVPTNLVEEDTDTYFTNNHYEPSGGFIS